MNQEGPPLEYLLRRMSETPADFLAEPGTNSAGSVSVAAVVSDVMVELGDAPPSKAALFEPMPSERNRLKIVLISCWLLHDDWFRSQPGIADRAMVFLSTSTRELAGVTPAAQFVADPDRREELVRLCLKDLGMRPAGETVAQAQDRLNTLSSVERQRVIRAARAAEERSRNIRAEMARKAKAEADAKIMRE